MTFKERLEYGKVGESFIADWFKSRGYYILPIYDVELDSGKGPTLYTPQTRLIAPDMFVFKGEKSFWIEAKHKTAFSWHRITSQWVTGIDLKHYLDYCKVDDETPFPVWLMFLQKGGSDKSTGEFSPSGLYGNRLSFLRLHENHRSDKWGHSGMVYWAIKSLVKLTE